jgi:hypothetical protein
MSRRTALAQIALAFPSLAFLTHCAGNVVSQASPVDGDAGTAPPAASNPDAEAVRRTLMNMRVENGQRIIECNSIPDHAYGPFPNRNCPIAVSPMEFTLRMTTTPAPAAKATPLGGWLFAVALNGVVFDPTGPFMLGNNDGGYQFEVMSKVARASLGLDANNAHVQPSGEYHYHGMPEGLISALGARDALRLVGYAADGYPVYGPAGHSDPTDPTSPVRALRPSYRLKSGARTSPATGTHDGTFVEDHEYVPGLGDLDEFNGREGPTPEFPDGTYHYVLTDAFPFMPRSWRGTPDKSFTHPSPRGLSAVPPELRKYTGT